MNGFMKKVCWVLIIVSIVIVFIAARTSIPISTTESNPRFNLAETTDSVFEVCFSQDMNEPLATFSAADETPATTEAPAPEETLDQVSFSFDAVPLYFQTDYPTTLYATGTVATSGCSITCLSMVASFLTDHQYFPDETARFMDEYSGTHVEVLEYGSDLLQLPWEKAENASIAITALEEGKIVIALMNANSLFTSNQHFIVLTGLTEDGRILVNDPYAPNYDNWRLAQGFEDGFIVSDITTGFSGGWIYDPGAMPKEPFIYEEEDRVELRYPEISLTAEEVALLAKIVWMEARGETFDGQQAVAEVAFNRMASKYFPDTLYGVLTSGRQFSTINFLEAANPTRTQYDAVRKALYGPYILPVDVVYFEQYSVNDHTWGSIGGHTFCYYE